MRIQVLYTVSLFLSLFVVPHCARSTGKQFLISYHLISNLGVKADGCRVSVMYSSEPLHLDEMRGRKIKRKERKRRHTENTSCFMELSGRTFLFLVMGVGEICKKKIDCF